LGWKNRVLSERNPMGRFGGHSGVEFKDDKIITQFGVLIG